MLAKKYGWEAVNCYIQEPLACDSDDEKRFRRAVKESKALNSDNSTPWKPRAPFVRAKQSLTLLTSNHNSPDARRVVIPASRHKLDPSQSEASFRCGRAGHFAKNCRAPIPSSNTTGRKF